MTFLLATGEGGRNPLTYDEAMMAASLDAYHAAIRGPEPEPRSRVVAVHSDRGTCPRCGREFPQNFGGVTPQHPDAGGVKDCLGSGQMFYEVYGEDRWGR